MRHKRILDIVREFSNIHILVVGDVMLDEYLRGKVDRISPEAPVPVLKIHSRVLRPGGAANVAKNIVAVGGKASLVGVIGRDDNALRFKQTLEESGVSTVYLLEESNRPTTVKTRIVAGSQQIVRTDIEVDTPLEESTRSKMYENLEKLGEEVDAVILSDYDKGVIDKEILTRLVRKSNEKNIPVAVDPNVTHFFDYENVTILTPNQNELENAVGRKINDEETLRAVGKEVVGRLRACALLVTKGERGVTLFDMQDHVSNIPTVAKQVYDVTGAGDTVISILTLALAAGATPLEAAKISNAAAGVVVGKRGTASLTQDELLEMIEELKMDMYPEG